MQVSVSFSGQSIFVPTIGGHTFVRDGERAL